MPRYIDADALKHEMEVAPMYAVDMYTACDVIDNAPTIGVYTAHEVAEIIAELLGDSCACNFNGIEEWLPMRCDLVNCGCPNTVGVACWEQYLKYRKDGEQSAAD